MRRWKCTLVTMFFVSTFVLAWWEEAGAVAFSFKINRFPVNQGGGDLLNDGFDDGLEPPSGPGDPTAYRSPTLGTFGASDESGSSLTLNNIGALDIVTFDSVSNTNVPGERKGARRRLPIAKSGGDFFVEADFAGILPADTGPIFGSREDYRISIRDFGFNTPLGTGTDDDFVFLRVVNIGGAPRIEFIDVDPSIILGATLLGTVSPGSLSSEVTLRLNVATSGVVTAFYNGNPILDSGGVIPATTTIYNGEDFAFARFSASSPVPEPSTLLLLASGLAGLGFFRRRRKREA